MTFFLGEEETYQTRYGCNSDTLLGKNKKLLLNKLNGIYQLQDILNNAENDKPKDVIKKFRAELDRQQEKGSINDYLKKHATKEQKNILQKIGRALKSFFLAPVSIPHAMYSKHTLTLWKKPRADLLERELKKAEKVIKSHKKK